jgi:hypothetical protein
MRKLILLLLALPLLVNAQFTENFSDGDFTNNPTWTGETTEFIVNASMQLQLQATAPYSAPSDTTYLSTSSTSLNTTEWQFWVKMSFATSANNHARFYLASDQANLEGSLNGYFVQLGDFGDGKDSISLYKQAGVVFTKLISGTVVYTNNSTNFFRVKVTRDNLGNWNLFSDPLGGTNFVQEGAASFDNTITSSLFSGVFCKYTSSNNTKIYFDDISVGPIIVDVTPPTLSSVLLTSPTTVDVYFSETVSTATAQTITNYSVDNSVGNPLSAIKDAANGSIVHLTFSSAFTPGTIYTLSVNNVQDLSSNTMLPDSRVFSLYSPKTFDVLINEIMADPDPSVGLPNYEYLELYNRTQIPLNLKNWTLNIGGSEKIIPEVIIQPDSFLIVTSTTGVSSLSAYGQTISLSSLSLTNTGQSLLLSDSTGNMIHYISYTDDWYQNALKAQGGWSIEQIDPLNPCGDEANWIASNDVSGGTPGRTNSVFASNPDNVAPQLNSVSVLSTTSIQLNFSEALDSLTLLNPATYTIDNGIGNPITVKALKPAYNKVILYLGTALLQNTLYTCTVTDTIKDCAGNTAYSLTKPFAIYDAKQFDVEITEIMADPDPPISLPNYEYIELYNRTVYPISLHKWKIQMGSTTSVIPDITINPNDYILLTTTTGSSALSAFAPTAGVTSFSLTNSGTTLTVFDSLSRIISEISYTDDWYRDSYKMNGGWSLEQIDPLNPCGGAENWRASISPTGGTPGGQNSVNAPNPDYQKPELVRISIIDSVTIEAFFSESLDSTYLKNVTNFSIDNAIGIPVSAHAAPPTYTSVILTLASPIQVGITYYLTITDTLLDCAGNSIPVNSKARFAFPQIAVANDIVINELLSNPTTEGVDFVEIYNRSQKVIDLKDLVLSVYDPITLALDEINEISSGSYLIFPGDYLVLTTDPTKVRASYATLNPNNFVKMVSFPGFNNDDGTVALARKNLTEVIDKFAYSADMFLPLLITTDGVSLERVNFNRPSDDKTNWHCAAETVGFGTPTYKNSQYSEGVVVDDPVSVSPEVFSPDNDGYNDVLNLNYLFDTPGYIATITIYDASGRLIRELIKSKYLGTSGTFSWDGITDDNEKARIGIYVIYFEVFDVDGNVKHYKKTAVLAGKL